MEWLRAHAAPGRAARVVAEQDLAGRAETEIAAYLRAEAAANVIYQPYAVSVLCPFDASSLPEGVLHDAQRTHPELAREGVVASSPLYTRPGPVRPGAVGDRGPAAVRRVDRLRGSRRPERRAPVPAGRAGRRGPGGRGRPGPRHRRGRGGQQRAGPWPGAAAAVGVLRTRGSWSAMCRTAAPGRTTRSAPYLVPEPHALRGQGLWLARQVADSVELASDATGTHVRVLARLPSAATGTSRPPPAERHSRARSPARRRAGSAAGTPVSWPRGSPRCCPGSRWSTGRPGARPRSARGRCPRRPRGWTP